MTLHLTPFEVEILKILVGMQLNADASIDTSSYNYEGGDKVFEEENGYSIYELETTLNGLCNQLSEK